MKRHNAIGLLALPAAAVALMSLASIANADTPDDDYMNYLAGQGITADRDDLIALGHEVCDTYGSIGSIGMGFHARALGLSNPQINAVLLASTKAYCPEHMPPWAR